MSQSNAGGGPSTSLGMTILGCRVDDVDADAATDAIIGFAKERSGKQIVTLGTEMVVYAQRDDRFREIVNACALSLCDTVGLLKVMQWRGAKLSERVTGVELMDHLCARAAREGIRAYLFGGAPGVADEAARELQRRYPGLQIAGTRNGYFKPEESASIAAAIERSGAQLLFVGLGSPKQEFWLAENVHATGVGAGIGIGGSLDVISGKVQRAPEAWRRLNLEWLYRLVKEPQRWRRQLALPQFVLLVVREAMFQRPSGRVMPANQEEAPRKGGPHDVGGAEPGAERRKS